MGKAKILHTTIFRLVAAYLLSFAASVAALGMITYLATSMALTHRMDTRIKTALKQLTTTYRAQGLTHLIVDVNDRERSRRSDALTYLVLGPHGERLAGRLPRIPLRMGWSDLKYIENESDNDRGELHVLFVSLAGGIRLAIAADLEQLEETKAAILYSFVSAFGAVVALGTIGGIALSFALLKRVETIRRTAEAIIAGDLSQRVPLRGSGDDLDRLSQTLNHMLDRIAELMESLRLVSADIAHDLKTPLARLRQRLEAAQTHGQSPKSHAAILEAAIVQVDEILGTFGALLRIAQIEAGTRRSGFQDVDLSAVFATVIEAFAPAAEDANKRLESKIMPHLHVLGDRELLTQMIANVIENAIRHTPGGTRIRVSLGYEEKELVARVTDNGPGVPEEERERLFQRFYRLERSRSTPGSGLGLSLVKAVADLHGIKLEPRDAKPGLQIIMKFQT